MDPASPPWEAGFSFLGTRARRVALLVALLGACTLATVAWAAGPAAMFIGASVAPGVTLITTGLGGPFTTVGTSHVARAV